MFALCISQVNKAEAEHLRIDKLLYRQRLLVDITVTPIALAGSGDNYSGCST